MKKSFRRGVELFRELGRAAVLRNIYIHVHFRTFFFGLNLETSITIVILHKNFNVYIQHYFQILRPWYTVF